MRRCRQLNRCAALGLVRHGFIAVPVVPASYIGKERRILKPVGLQRAGRSTDAVTTASPPHHVQAPGVRCLLDATGGARRGSAAEKASRAGIGPGEAPLRAAARAAR